MTILASPTRTIIYLTNLFVKLFGTECRPAIVCTGGHHALPLSRRHLIVLVHRTALRADRTLRPQHSLDMLECGGFASALVRRGFSVALPNYPLAHEPEPEALG